MTNWYAPSYSPNTKLLYVATSTECDVFTSSPSHIAPDMISWEACTCPTPWSGPRGALQALDPLTGEQKWEFKYFSTPNGGALSTAGDVVFCGRFGREFYCAGCANREGLVARAARRGHLFDRDHVQGRRKTVCRLAGGISAVCVCSG